MLTVFIEDFTPRYQVLNINTDTNIDVDTQVLPLSSNLILGGGTTGEKLINMSHHIVILTQSCHGKHPSSTLGVSNYTGCVPPEMRLKRKRG